MPPEGCHAIGIHPSAFRLAEHRDQVGFGGLALLDLRDFAFIEVLARGGATECALSKNAGLTRYRSRQSIKNEQPARLPLQRSCQN